MRLRALLLAAVAAAGLISGCAGKVDYRQQVRDDIARTLATTRHFTYTERAGGVTTVVTGAVEDDYRFDATVTVNGRPAYQAVVADDSRAVRFADAAWLDRSRQLESTLGAGAPTPAAAGPSPSGSPAPAAAPTASAVLAAADSDAALGKGDWVVDPHGASTFGPGALAAAKLGQDPMADALTALSYLSAAVDAASDVQTFNPESTSYRPDDDPFPRPQDGVTRLDVLPAALPPRAAPGLRQSGGLLNAADFRRMAVYVRDGLIVDVRESIDVKYVLTESDQDLIGHLADAGITVPDGSVDAQAAAIEGALGRTGLRAATAEPLRFRTMSMELSDLGAAVHVKLPDGAVQGTLTDVADLGQVLQQSAP